MIPEKVTLGFWAKGMLQITPKEFISINCNEAFLIDVREEYLTNFKQFGVVNVINCPFSKLETNYEMLPEKQLLVFADATGIKSFESVKFVAEKGLKNIANLAGGMVEWERDNLPVIIDKSGRLSGSCMCKLSFREKNK